MANYISKIKLPNDAVYNVKDSRLSMDSNNKISIGNLPDVILGQLIYGGTWVPNGGTATLSNNAKTKLNTTSNTIVLENSTTRPGGYVANEGIYYIASENGTRWSIDFEVGDWLISTGSAWVKIDNTDAVKSVNGQTGIVELGIPEKTSDLTNDSNFISDSNYVHTDNNYTTSDKSKLSGIAAGAEVNVQSDWGQTDTTSDSYIKNKPALASVATSGSYTDLSNKPNIPDDGVGEGVLTIKMNNVSKGTFSANAPLSKSIDLGTVLTEHQDISGKENTSNKVSSWSTTVDNTHYPSEKLVKDSLDSKANSADLATVATSGSYNDLTNKPTIPTVNNATLTIQKNGTTVNTFTANASSNVTANIIVPTKTSDLTNDSDFITNSTAQISESQVTNLTTDLAAKANQSTTYTKTEVDALVNSTFRYKGTVATYSALPTTGRKTGDVWNIEQADPSHGVKAGDNVAFTGSTWDVLAGTVDLSAYYTKTEVDSGLSGKVDKITGKGLSTNDYTTAEKNKLAGIAAGAEVNVQSDWNQTNSSADDYIKNKPTIPDVTGKMDKVTGAVDGNFPMLDANGNVVDSGYSPMEFQSDWNQTESNAPDYIWHKPSIPTNLGDLSDIMFYDVLHQGDILRFDGTYWSASTETREVYRFTLVKNGTTYSLPSGVTYATILAAYNAGDICIGRVENVDVLMSSEYQGFTIDCYLNYKEPYTNGAVCFAPCDRIKADTGAEEFNGFTVSNTGYVDVKYVTASESLTTNNVEPATTTTGLSAVKIVNDKLYAPTSPEAVIGSLNTTATASQTATSGESFGGNITLHKISKTGKASDLINDAGLLKTSNTDTTSFTPSTRYQKVKSDASSNLYVQNLKIEYKDNYQQTSGTGIIQNNTLRLHTVCEHGEIGYLTDVSVSSPSNGQALVYDSASSKWKNTNIPSGAGILNTTNTSNLQPAQESMSGNINLHVVAKTGEYESLRNKPTIPTVYNPTISITQGDESKGSFTLNQQTESSITLDEGIYKVKAYGTGSNITVDKSIADIQRALRAGKIVIMHWQENEYDGDDTYVDWTNILIASAEAAFIGESDTIVVFFGSDIKIQGVTQAAGDAWEFIPYGYVMEPDTEGTAGQVLATDGDGSRYWTTVSGGGGGTGTVTSVRVQATNGLTSSQDTAQSVSLNTTIGIDSSHKLPTTTEWNSKANASDIPGSGELISVYNGAINHEIPSGDFLPAGGPVYERTTNSMSVVTNVNIDQYGHVNPDSFSFANGGVDKTKIWEMNDPQEADMLIYDSTQNRFKNCKYGYQFVTLSELENDDHRYDGEINGFYIEDNVDYIEIRVYLYITDYNKKYYMVDIPDSVDKDTTVRVFITHGYVARQGTSNPISPKTTNYILLTNRSNSECMISIDINDQTYRGSVSYTYMTGPENMPVLSGMDGQYHCKEISFMGDPQYQESYKVRVTDQVTHETTEETEWRTVGSGLLSWTVSGDLILNEPY